MSEPILAPNSTWFTQGGTTVSKGSITHIELKDSYTPTGTTASSWDASAAKDESVMAYVEGTTLTISGNGSGRIFANVDSSNIFNGFGSLVTITGGNIFDTSRATTFERMFQTCFALESVDTSTWITNNVTTMKAMFQGATSIGVGGLDVSGWDTSNVTTMQAMFNMPSGYTNTNLLTLDVSNWDTSRVTNMNCLFQNCRNLDGIDVSKWDVSSCSDMGYMFNYCESLRELDLSVWDTSSCSIMNNMFNHMVNLRRISTGENFRFSGSQSSATLPTPSVEYISSATGYWHRLPDYTAIVASDIPDNTKAVYIAVPTLPILAPNKTWFAPTASSVTKATINKIEIKSKHTPDTSTLVDSWDASAAKDGSVTAYVEGDKITLSGNDFIGICANADSSNVFNGFGSLVTIVGGNIFDTSAATTFERMFQACFALESVDTSTWNTDNVTTMKAMFQGATSIGGLDVSGWNTSNVENMQAMFNMPTGYVNTNLTTLDVSNWDTSKVESMNGLFQNCQGLDGLDVSDWDTSACTDMEYAFNYCTSLTELDVSNWIVSKVETLHSMFQRCESLVALDVSDWDTSACTNMCMVFNFCTSLSELDVSNWDTSACTNMERMFNGCISLDELDVSNWNVGKVESFSGMFSCGSNYGETPMILKELDVSGWDTSSATDMSFMFYGCRRPKSIDVSGWDVRSVTTFDHMFAHSHLTIGDISNWKAVAATNLNALFHTVQNITLNVSGFDTSKVTSFEQMFEACSSLTEIIGLDNFDTSKGFGFGQMFRGCSKLKNLDLSGFDTRNAKNGEFSSLNGSVTACMDGMFYNMTSLEKITLGENFSFNGDGTATTGRHVAVLPTPSSEYIIRATGMWYTYEGVAYSPDSIPNLTAETYYAVDQVEDRDYLIKGKSLVVVADSIRAKAGLSVSLPFPEGFSEAIRSFGEGEVLAGLVSGDLVSVSIPNGVTKIKQYLFYEDTNIENLLLPDSVTEIDRYAFYHCANLKLSQLPSSLVEIKDCAMCGIGSGLTFTEIPSSVTTIGRNAFLAAHGLTEITFKGTPSLIDETAFAECINISTINVPWIEGEVTGAPWGATNATINYSVINE